MEKRMSRVLSQFEDIREEKRTLEEILQKAINQVYSCVERVKNNPEEVKQKDCSLILSYELNVLKKITDFNFELESIIESSPLGQLKITEKRYETSRIAESENKAPVSCENGTEFCAKQEQSCENSEVPEFVETIECNLKSIELGPNQRQDSPSESEIGASYSSRYLTGPILENYNAEEQSQFSDMEIRRELRNSLEKFSKKLGLNAECISSMTSFYQKPSTSHLEDFQLPPSFTVSDLIVNEASSPNLTTLNDDTFEIPEKDTNIPINTESVKEECTIISPPLESSNRIILEGPMHQEGDLGNFNQPFNSADPAVGLCADISSMSTDAEVFDLSKSDDSSSEVCHRKEPFHCQPTPGDLLPNNIDEKCDKTDDDISKSKKIVYSALEKLNNANYFNRKDEEKFNENVPDLKLKPTVSQIIKNDFELKNTPKKKKNRKRTKWDEDDVIYELQPKSAPCTGMQCVFSHIESPSEFYIHIVDEESVVIDLMTEQINEYFQGTVSDFESKEEICAYIVDYGLAFISEYNGWSRVRILDWDLESKCDEVLVQLVDFGNKRRVSYKNLRKMTKDLAQYPMLAVKCHLPLMYPPNSTFFNRLTAWPAETIDALVGLSGLFVLETAESQENKIFQIVYAAQEGDSVAIDMYNLQETTPEQTVGQILLDLRLAEQIVEEPDEENLEVEEFLQDVNTLGMVDNINEAIAGYDPRDEARICRFTKSNGTCYKGKNCKLEHIPLDKDGFTTDKEPVFREAMETLQLPANGDSVILLITGIKDACSFYAQIVKNIHKEKNRDQEYVIDIDFYTLLATMNNPKIGQSYEKFKIPPAIGEVVIAQHRYNRKWLRAVVRERLTWNDDESDEYQVYMVDFGDCLNLPRGALRKIKPHYLQLPFQAIECYIHNYRAKRNCDTKEVKKFFYKNLYYHNFVAVAMSASLPLKVWIKTFNEFDIAKKLVENGFAEERKYDSNPQDGCLIELY